MKKILPLLCLLLLLSGCAADRDSGSGQLRKETLPAQWSESSQSVEEPAAPTGTVSEATEPSSQAEPSTAPLTEKDIITLLYDESGEDDGMTYRYRVPQLKLDGDDAARINLEILDTVADTVERELDNVAADLSVICYEADYELIWSAQDRFALVLHTVYPNDCVYYSVYNYDLTENRMLPNAELLAAVGLSEAEFLSLAKQRAVEVFEQKYADFPASFTEDPFYDQQREFSASDENIRPDMRMYLNEDGELMLISAIGSLAGAESYEEVYPLFTK